ncbi:helix-turn-helix domain-containing protein [Roseobacteraceae bacterium NS-SX3]
MTNPTRSPAELRSMFGANLRQLTRQYPSVSELSRRLGINRTQFNRYLSGESFPRPDVLDRICSFFGVDARILLEPADSIAGKGYVLNGPYLADFLGHGLSDLTEDMFPSGFYRFSRRSFVSPDQFVIGLVYVHRQDGTTYVKGFEAKEAMRFQGLPDDPRAREFRGFVSRHEDGVAFVIARRKAMTYSFNFLARVASLENNFWAGYVARTVRENESGERVTRMVYEHLGRDTAKVLPAARTAGFASADELLPFHRHLLHAGEPFR